MAYAESRFFQLDFSATDRNIQDSRQNRYDGKIYSSDNISDDTLAGRKRIIMSFSNSYYIFTSVVGAIFAISYIIAFCADSKLRTDFHLMVPFTTILTTAVLSMMAYVELNPSEQRYKEIPNKLVEGARNSFENFTSTPNKAFEANYTSPSNGSEPFDFYSVRYPLTWLFLALNVLYVFTIVAYSDEWMAKFYEANHYPHFSFAEASQHQKDGFRSHYVVLGVLLIMALIANYRSMLAHQEANTVNSIISKRYDDTYLWYMDYNRLIHVFEISLYLDIGIWYIVSGCLLFSSRGLNFDTYHLIPTVVFACMASFIVCILFSRVTFD